MKKYNVTIEATIRRHIEVEAVDEVTAQISALDEFSPVSDGEEEYYSEEVLSCDCGMPIMNGQELIGKIHTLGSRDDMNCIVLGSVNDVEIRMNVEEINKIITILDFDLEKKKVHTYATLNHDSVDAIYKAVDEYHGQKEC